MQRPIERLRSDALRKKLRQKATIGVLLDIVNTGMRCGSFAAHAALGKLPKR